MIEDSLNSEKLEDYANTLYELRKSKGMTIEAARKRSKTSYYGVMMVKKVKRMVWWRVLSIPLQIL